jgi:transcriptional regulator with XRE-family HTH domain
LIYAVFRRKKQAKKQGEKYFFNFSCKLSRIAIVLLQIAMRLNIRVRFHRRQIGKWDELDSRQPTLAAKTSTRRGWGTQRISGGGFLAADFWRRISGDGRLTTDHCSLTTAFMKLGEKIRYLREVEGSLRGLDRAMSQQEMVRDLAAETGSKLSQSYLSQIESGARPHLTNTSRQLLARFFKVHPGYLVDDPEGYSPELQSDLRPTEDKLDLWLVAGAERFRRDPELMQALLTLARHEHTRECVLLLEAILETPGLAPRLVEVLRPKSREQGTGNRDQAAGKTKMHGGKDEA